MVEYTMFVSSREGGTQPYRRLSAKEFHELQWNSDLEHKGRFVEEKSLDLNNMSMATKADSDYEVKEEPQSGSCRKSKAHVRSFEFHNLIKRFRSRNNKGEEGNNCTWHRGDPKTRSTSSFQDAIVPLFARQVDEWEIPNANFARKFGIVSDQNPLPTSIKELPVAEDKATTNVVTGSPAQGLTFSRRFQGPFTPQLWFDSGLDYRWKKGDP